MAPIDPQLGGASWRYQNKLPQHYTRSSTNLQGTKRQNIVQNYTEKLLHSGKNELLRAAKLSVSLLSLATVCMH